MRPHRRAELTRPTEWGPLQQPCSGCMKKYGRSGLRLLRWPATTPPTSFRHCPALPCPALPCPALPCPALPFMAMLGFICVHMCLCLLACCTIMDHAQTPSWGKLTCHHKSCRRTVMGHAGTSSRAMHISPEGSSTHSPSYVVHLHQHRCSDLALLSWHSWQVLFCPTLHFWPHHLCLACPQMHHFL